MPDIDINGVAVDFPYPTPYNVQKHYMEKVVECLKDSKNGVLESPTGTGKTLSLLCASLGWLKQIKDEAERLQNSTNLEPGDEVDAADANILRSEPPNDVTSMKIPKIVYASRTHTQLTQVINELKGTGYKYMNIGVLASRDQLCIHPELAYDNNATKTEKCKAITKKQPTTPVISTQQSDCSYYRRHESLKQDAEFRAEHFDGKLLDVEDLRTSGLNHHYCPYYMSKTLIDDADIVFMPYNYLLDPIIRNFIGVELSDAVIILDEAHNVPQVCEDSASIEFKSTDITDAVEEVKKIAMFATDNETCRKLRPLNFNVSELRDLEQILIRFGGAINDIPLSRTGNSLQSAEFDGDYMFTIMENADIAYHTSLSIIMLIMQTLQYVSDCIQLLRSDEVEQENRSTVVLTTQSPGLRKFKNILWTTFPTCGDDFREEIKTHYRVYVAYDRSPVLHSNGPVKVINYWCFSPKFGLQHLVKKNVRSIIFTSGTMSPLQPFITSLGIPIQVQLQNGHIIDSSQVLVEIVSHGPDSIELLSNFSNRSNEAYLNSLGCTVLRFSEVIPNGLLIFFPSYIILDSCKRFWQNSGVWGQITRIKPIFVEPRVRNEFTHTMHNYYRQINNETMNGAIFMAVCRGKVSEGLDFADINGRAVIVTGLPLAPCFDAKVRLKKNYMQRNYTAQGQSLNGDQWYQLEASRAVNQAIGRVIRHRRDYGAILLCDSRFGRATQKSQLSQWVQRHIRNDSSRRSFDIITSSITQFFRNQRSEPSPVETANQVEQLATHPANGSIASNLSPVAATNQANIHSLEIHVARVSGTSLEQNINGNNQSIIVQQSESPMTSVTRQISSFPISSPPSIAASENTPTAVRPSTTGNSNGTPSKQKCSINLIQRFYEEP